MAVQSAHAKVFVGVSVLLFAACTSVTVVWCKSMSALGGTPMRGGWTMSMAWMRMPGQSWLGAAASFLAMWVVMTVAMMLPSLVPSLLRYREALRTAGAALGAASAAPLDRLTAFAGAGYLFVWTLFGVSVFPLGIALAGVAMRLPAVARAVPIASGVVVLIAGTLQLTAWKARHLDCCRALPSGGLRADAAAAWRYGLRMGRHWDRSDRAGSGSRKRLMRATALCFKGAGDGGLERAHRPLAQVFAHHGYHLRLLERHFGDAVACDDLAVRQQTARNALVGIVGVFVPAESEAEFSLERRAIPQRGEELAERRCVADMCERG